MLPETGPSSFGCSFGLFRALSGACGRFGRSPKLPEGAPKDPEVARNCLKLIKTARLRYCSKLPGA
eukprot:3495450-Alexandrium_andersonii.AAC.1